VVGKAVARPPNLEGWIRETPAALETLRILLERPAGNPVVDMERRAGDPNQVVRTLNQLQHAGFVKFQVEALTHELVAKVPDRKVDDLKVLLQRLKPDGWPLSADLGQAAKRARAK
jgi:hypothetical protein